MARIITGNPRASPGALAAIIKANDLDAPVYVQFFRYVSQIFHGDLGTDTIYHVPEIQIMKEYLPITLELVVIGQIIGVLIGLYTGAIAAANRNRAPDYGMKALYLTTWSAPVFSGRIRNAAGGRVLAEPAAGDWRGDPTLPPPAAVTGAPLSDALNRREIGCTSGAPFSTSSSLPSQSQLSDSAS